MKAQRVGYKSLLISLLSLSFFTLGTSGVEAAVPSHANDYPYQDVSKGSCSNGYACVIDPWRFYERECTSYVAWRLNREFEILGLDFSFNNDLDGDGGIDLGSAVTWATAAAELGYEVNDAPKIGSIAYWGSTPSGHVAYVESINEDGSVNVSEYYSSLNGVYSFRENARADKYIHIHSDLIQQRYQENTLEILRPEENSKSLFLPSKEGLEEASFSLNTVEGMLKLSLSRRVVAEDLLPFRAGRVLGAANSATSPEEAVNQQIPEILWEDTYIPQNEGIWVVANFDEGYRPELLNLKFANTPTLTVFALQYDRETDSVKLEEQEYAIQVAEDIDPTIFTEITDEQILIETKGENLPDTLILNVEETEYELFFQENEVLLQIIEEESHPLSILGIMPTD